MPGETDVRALVAGIAPVLRDGEFVFVSVGRDAALPAGIAPFATVREDEGLTLVVERAAAERAGLSGSAPFRAITLSVHSSLEAVGLTAAVATALAEAGIAANVIAGVHHDHVFVPAERATGALRALRSLQARGASRGEPA